MNSLTTPCKLCVPLPRICTSVYAFRRAHVLLQRLCIVGWVMGFFHGILYRSYYTGFHGFFEMACGVRVVATHLVRGWQLWETDNSWSVLIPYYTYRLILFYSCHILHWRWVLSLRWRFRVESVDVLCVQLLNSFTTRKIEKWLWHSTFELFAKKTIFKKDKHNRNYAFPLAKCVRLGECHFGLSLK